MIPSLFVGHGAPTIIWEDNEYTDYLKRYADTLPRPRSIIVFSAHWESPVQLIGSSSRYEMIYDFSGFPRDLSQVVYPATGDAELAREIQGALLAHGIHSELDAHRGIDHGVWTVLKLLYPKADIPIVTMSVSPERDPSDLYKIGASLTSFKNRDVLIVGSGGIVHNLGKVRFGAQQVDGWASEFNRWVADKVESWDLDAVFDYRRSAPHAQSAVPSSEHFVNLLIAMGAGDVQKKARLLKSIFQYGNLSLDLWEFE